MCNFEMIWYKIYFDLKAEAARGSLGLLWLVLEPLLYLGALSVVFIAIRQQTDEAFLAFLFVGLVVWKWFAMSVTQGSNSIVGHTGLMRQVYIPKTFFPLVSLGVNFCKFFMVFCLLIIALLALGFEANVAWLSLPVLLIIQLLFLASVTFIVSWAVCYIPDIKMVVDNSLLFLFFLSGILFDISKAPDYIRDYLYLNPVLIIIDSFRSVLLQGEWPNWYALLIVVLCSLLLLLLSIRLLHKHDRKIPKMVLK